MSDLQYRMHVSTAVMVIAPKECGCRDSEFAGSPVVIDLEMEHGVIKVEEKEDN